MAVRRMHQVRSAGAAPREARLRKSERSSHVSGQLIVRFRKSAIQQVAANAVPMTAAAHVAAAAMPDDVSGPLELLKNQGGLTAVKPLFVPDSKFAKPKAGVMALAAIHGSLSTSSTSAPREALRGFQLVELKDEKITPALLKRLRASKAIDFVEPVPNRWKSAVDPMLNRQWGLRAIRWFGGKLPNAAKVHVAVLDGGIDAGHPDLKDAIEEYRHDGNKARDFDGHGTHVSGIIAAVVNNSTGIAGVANCRLHVWKVFDDPEPGSSEDEGEFNFEVYSAALASALDSNIKAINLSIGGEENSKAEAAVFKELREAGVVIVASMGNEFEEGNPKEFPGAYRGVLAVGAVDEADRRASFSNTGAHIGLVAPGVDILSTVPRVSPSGDPTDYDAWDGTSMATPFVTGAAALVYAKQGKSKAAADAVIARLTSTAKKLPGMKKKPFTKQFGAGQLDIAAALKGT